MKSLLIERVQNGWIVRPYGCEWRGDQAFVFSTVPDLIAALPILLTEPVTEGPPGIQLDIKPQWHADTPAHLFNCPDCGKYMSHSDLDLWHCQLCQTYWRCTHTQPSQSPIATDPPHCCSSGPEE